MIDFHTHILPALDDGAKDVKTAVRMINMYSDTVDAIIATPHFNAGKQNIEHFLSKRDKSYTLLKEILPNENRIILGAEVYLTPDILSISDIERLCIGNTKCILLELPHEPITLWIERFLFQLIAEKKIIPILAHVERYFPVYNSIDELENLLRMDIYTQVNSDYFLDNNQYARMLQQRNMIHVLGSDCHNAISRTCNLDKVAEKITNEYGLCYLDKLTNNAQRLLHNKKPKTHILPRKKSIFSFFRKNKS